MLITKMHQIKKSLKLLFNLQQFRIKLTRFFKYFDLLKRIVQILILLLPQQFFLIFSKRFRIIRDSSELFLKWVRFKLFIGILHSTTHRMKHLDFSILFLRNFKVYFIIRSYKQILFLFSLSSKMFNRNFIDLINQIKTFNQICININTKLNNLKQVLSNCHLGIYNLTMVQIQRSNLLN